MKKELWYEVDDQRIDLSKVTYQNRAHPGGSLPSGLVNMTVVKMPFVSLQKMKAQLKNPKYNK